MQKEKLINLIYLLDDEGYEVEGIGKANPGPGYMIHLVGKDAVGGKAKTPGVKEVFDKDVPADEPDKQEDMGTGPGNDEDVDFSEMDTNELRKAYKKNGWSYKGAKKKEMIARLNGDEEEEEVAGAIAADDDGDEIVVIDETGEDDESDIDADVLRQRLGDLAKAGFSKQVKAIIVSFGVDAFTSIPENKLPKVLTMLVKLEEKAEKKAKG